ncbi:MAG: hypothetical protein KJ847_04395, partial [Firmicutes bacterium]|nr:hypothetical protein [Bacillota bacterium]
LSVLAWIVLIVILSIPIVNIIFAVWMFIRRGTSDTVKNFFVAYLILYVLAAWLGIFNGAFANLQGLFG